MKSFQIGQRASATRTFSGSDVEAYARLTGDANPLYLDAEAARSAGFKDRIVPGGLLGAMISQLLGIELPGRGTNWMKQLLRFPSPAYLGQPITATVEIVRLRPDKDLVNLSTRCTDPTGAVCCDGEALVMAREMF